jgi:hypothetical protein
VVRISARIAACVGPAVIAVLCGLVLAVQDARAQERHQQRHVGPYFVEFRARPSGDIGHNFIVYGRLDGDGRKIERHYAGLIPDVSGWHGLIRPIHARVGASAEDIHTPPLARYRRTLRADEYALLQAKVRRMRATVHRWHAMFFNCNDFSIAIADTLGLRRPPNLMPPQAWVLGLRALNER